MMNAVRSPSVIPGLTRDLFAFLGSSEEVRSRIKSEMTVERVVRASLLLRHAELVSASTVPRGAARADEWTLKQVQGDGDYWAELVP
jgi:hypothetical protein